MNLAYPIGDLTLLAMLAIAIGTLGWRARPDLALLAARMATFAVSDSIFLIQSAGSGYVIGTLLDAGWLLALLIIALAATWSPALHAGRATSYRSRPAVPFAAGFVALALIAADTFGTGDLATVLALVTLALVILRMVISLRETQRLLDARARDAVIDPLTGLANRRRLLLDLEAAIADATAAEPRLLVLFDLDEFKPYNDTFGHGAGDTLLTRIAQNLERAVGPDGRAYRMSGDEFCALLDPRGGPPERSAPRSRMRWRSAARASSSARATAAP